MKNYRNPPPGSNDPKDYDDPVTMPAGDIADNPYWRRDVRRAYPKISAITQGDAVALLTMGNAANPSPKLLTGEEGSKQLVLAQQEGEKGLATFFEKEKATAVFGADGMPPLPVAYRNPDATKYDIKKEQAYSAE